ncbi:MAG: PVC-type heme-binding CxxCH protein [Planctomycetota bacterium]
MLSDVPKRFVTAAYLGCLLVCLDGSSLAQESSANPATTPFPRTPPTEAKDAQKSFHVLHGFRLELLASEPMVTDPIAIEYDEFGRAYVVEMSDYPYTDKSTDKPNMERTTDLPIGRIRLLEDLDGDGDFDRGSIFASELSWPTGIALWQGGVFVAATPDLWYLKDTDGDRKADVREKVFSGFRKYNVQAVINNLKWSLDHRIYGAGSSNGGKIVSAALPMEKPTPFTQNDFRFDPRVRVFETLAGGARFGNTFDDWGNRFICNIRNPAQHVVLENRYLSRNPFVPIAKTIQDVAESGDNVPVFRRSPPEPWRVLRAERWLTEMDRKYPRSETAATGFFTSASGITIYRGDAYPSLYRGNIFLGEVSSNLIHRQAIENDGVTFSSRRVDPKAEFAASTDLWFRPVNFTNAPDGTLHVCDMYRETIEHPWSIPDDIKAKLDLESGRDRGRIYRLAPPGFVVKKMVKLGDLSTAELVPYLGHANAWHRETAHRLLFERQDTTVASAVRQCLGDGSNPLARLHALWTLQGWNLLNENDLAQGLADRHPGIREHSIKLAEPYLNSSAQLRKLVLALRKDEDIRVRFQLALSTGEIAPEERIRPLATIVSRDPGDEWIRTAVLSSSREIAGRLAATLTKDPEHRKPVDPAFLAQLAAIAGAVQDKSEIHGILKLLGDPFPADGPHARALTQGLGDGLKRSGRSLAVYVQEQFPSQQAMIGVIFESASRDASNPTLAVESRESATDLLRHEQWIIARDRLVPLLDPKQPASLQLRAVRALASFPEPDVAEILLGQWRRLTPAVRTETVEALLARKERMVPLFNAIESGTIAASQISPTRRTLLTNHPDAVIRQRANQLFGAASTPTRKQAFQRYELALARKPDPGRGKTVFQNQCATCHLFAGTGKQVGPDLATVRHRTSEEILLHVLEPNREVAPNFLEYVVTVDDGRILTGIIESENANSITLKRAEDVRETLLRQNIDEMASTNKSLMPDGLEQKITPEEMADLIAFIREGTKP